MYNQLAVTYFSNLYLKGKHLGLANFERISPSQEGDAAALLRFIENSPNKKSSVPSGRVRVLEDGTTVPIEYTPEEIYRSKRKRQGRATALRLNEPSIYGNSLTRQQQFDNAVARLRDPENRTVLRDVNAIDTYEKMMRSGKFDPIVEQKYISARDRIKNNPDLGSKLIAISSAYDDLDNIRATAQPTSMNLKGLKSRVKERLNSDPNIPSVDNLYVDVNDVPAPAYVNKETLKGKAPLEVKYTPTVKENRATARVRDKIMTVVNDVGLRDDPQYKRPLTPQYIANRAIQDTGRVLDNSISVDLPTSVADRAIADTELLKSIPGKVVDRAKEDTAKVVEGVKEGFSNAANSVVERGRADVKRTVRRGKQELRQATSRLGNLLSSTTRNVPKTAYDLGYMGGKAADRIGDVVSETPRQVSNVVNTTGQVAGKVADVIGNVVKKIPQPQPQPTPVPVDSNTELPPQSTPSPSPIPDTVPQPQPDIPSPSPQPQPQPEAKEPVTREQVKKAVRRPVVQDPIGELRDIYEPRKVTVQPTPQNTVSPDPIPDNSSGSGLLRRIKKIPPRYLVGGGLIAGGLGLLGAANALAKSNSERKTQLQPSYPPYPPYPPNPYDPYSY